MYESAWLLNLAYLLKRALFRIGNNFLLYFTISLIITLFLTWMYYAYLKEIVKHEAYRLMSFIRRPKPKAPVRNTLLTKEAYTKRRQQVKEKRKQQLTAFEK